MAATDTTMVTAFFFGNDDAFHKVEVNRLHRYHRFDGVLFKLLLVQGQHYLMEWNEHNDQAKTRNPRW